MTTVRELREILFNIANQDAQVHGLLDVIDHEHFMGETLIDTLEQDGYKLISKKAD